MSISDIICKHLKARSNCLSPERHRKPAPSVPPALKFKRPEPVDTCEHGILRKNCEVPECHPELQKKPSPVTDMMAVRNQVVRCQDAIENYPWKDAEGAKLDGCRMLSIMMRYARHAFAPAQQVFLSSMEVNMARWTLYRYQQAAVSARLLQETGKRTRKNIPLFVISESVLKEWAEKNPIEKEIEQRFRELSRKPIDPEDAAEEAASLLRTNCRMTTTELRMFHSTPLQASRCTLNSAGVFLEVQGNSIHTPSRVGRCKILLRAIQI